MRSKLIGSTLLLVTISVGMEVVPSQASTLKVSVPGLTGRYFDADWLPGVDGRLLRYQDDAPVDGLDSFETIDQVKVRVSGFMTPSTWELRRNAFDGELVFIDSPGVDSGTLLIDEWSELSGLEFFLHQEDDWGRAVAAGHRGQIIRPLTGGEVAFSYELIFDTFFVPSHNEASAFNMLYFSHSLHIQELDLSPKPVQTSLGLIDITEVELIVEGTLLVVPEPSTFILSALVLACLVTCGHRRRPNQPNGLVVSSAHSAR